MSLRISSYVILEHPALPWRKKLILSSMQGKWLYYKYPQSHSWA